jgi:hypothetical protein
MPDRDSKVRHAKKHVRTRVSLDATITRYCLQTTEIHKPVK